MEILQRPERPGISRERLGITGAVASILGWAALRYFEVEVPEDVLLAAAALILAAVQWRARNQRVKGQ